MDRWKYDVFLSFRGEDTRRNFVDHLFMALKQNGICAFRDDSGLHRRGGEEVYRICKAIERSRFSIVIFSENYASSPWCLRELVGAINSKHKLVPIFYHIKPEVVRKQTGSYAKAFAKHQVSNRAEVDEWKQALSIASNLSGWDLNDTKNGSEYKFIDHISKEVRKMLSDEPLHPGFQELKYKLNDHYPYHSERGVAIFWDMENCRLPVNVSPAHVVGNIFAFLGGQTGFQTEIAGFSAYANFSKVSSKIKVGYERAGIKLINVSKGSKDDACGRAILVDLFLYAKDNPEPSSIMLISRDVDFANALHVLSLRGYNVFHVIPSWVDVSFALITTTTNLSGWSSVVHGGVSSSRSQIKENPNAVNKEESIESQGLSMGSQPLSEYSPDDVMPVQHGDLASLKGQLVKLLESFNGELRLSCLASEYRKSFKKHLRVSDYKASKLVDLLKKISDVISVEGWGQEKFVKLIKMINQDLP